jgi:hypothetical protein
MALTWLVWVSFHLTIGVWCIFILLLYLALFSLVACFRLKEISAYWAPSSGEIWNFLRVFNMIGRLYYGWMISWGGGFLVALFFNISANYHIDMISFIKFFPVIRFFLLQRRLGEVSCLCCLINLLLNFKTFDCCFVDLCWVLFHWRRRVVFSLVYSSFLLLRWLLFA